MRGSGCATIPISASLQPNIVIGDGASIVQQLDAAVQQHKSLVLRVNVGDRGDLHADHSNGVRALEVEILGAPIDEFEEDEHLGPFYDMAI